MKKNVDVLDLAYSRVLFNFMSACLFVYFSGKHVTRDVPSRFNFHLSYRSIMLLVGQIMNVYAISLLPLSLLTIIQNTQAFWAAVLGYFINGERFLAVEGIGIIACFVGVLMIAMSADDDSMQHANCTQVDENGEADTVMFFGMNAMKLIGIGVMLFVAFNDATLNVLARTMKDLHYSLIQFWFSAIGLSCLSSYFIINALLTQEWPDMFYYTSAQSFNVALTGFFSALNLTCLVIAYQNDSSATVSLMGYIALVYAFIADVAIFGSSFDKLEITGTAIITFFNFFIIWYRVKFAAPNSIENP